jgi:hypothetical protein
MSVQVKRRREAASFLATFVGAPGELIVDTTNNRVQVHDGATPGGFAAAKLSEVVSNTRTSVADASYNALPSDRTIAFTALSAARSVTLPLAASYPMGTILTILDETGLCSPATPITIIRAGTDMINGATSAVVATAYGYVALQSNGAGHWTIVDQIPFSGLTTLAQSASLANIQLGVAELLVALSGTTVTTGLQIPARAIVLAVSSRTIGAIGGAPSYGVGVAGNPTQFGGSLGIALGSTNIGVIGPTAFYSPTPLVVTPTSGSFTSGQVRLALHYLAFSGPSS